MWALLALFLLQAPDFNTEGTKALDEGRFEAAVQAFQKAVEADPADAFAHFNLALSHSMLHQDAEGVAEYRKTLELKPGLYEAELNLGILLLRQKDASGAADVLAKAALQKPAEFRPRYYLGEAQLAAGALEDAAASLQAAVELDAKSAPAEMGLAHALERQGKLAEAAPHVRRAAQLDAHYQGALMELAGLYEKNHQAQEAMEIYRGLPDDGAAQERLGALLLDERKSADAIAPLEAAFQKAPTPANRIALARAYTGVRQLDKALPLLSEAVAGQPADYEVRMLYGRVLRDSRQYNAAAGQFSAALKIRPEESKGWSELGSVLYLVGDYQQSLAAFERARELGENTPGNWFLRAIMLDKLKQRKPALEAYERFLSMSQGQNPDQEFQARQRARILRRELEKR